MAVTHIFKDGTKDKRKVPEKIVKEVVAIAKRKGTNEK